MAAHRYWRLWMTATQENGAYCAFAEVELREAYGGADVTGSGTALASSSYSGSTPASAVDNNPATHWASDNVEPWWWGYDFGAGVAKSIAEVWMRARSDTAYIQAPRLIDLEWSDDGAIWNFAKRINTESLWTQGSAQVLGPATSPLAINSITPNHGPDTGGTRVRIVHNGGL